MVVAQLRPAAAQRDLEHQIGQRRQMVGQRFHAELPGEVLREQAEHLGMMRLAQHVHPPLGVVFMPRQLCAQSRREFLPVRRSVERARVEQFVQQQGWRVTYAAAQPDAASSCTTFSSACGYS